MIVVIPTARTGRLDYLQRRQMELHFDSGSRLRKAWQWITLFYFPLLLGACQVQHDRGIPAGARELGYYRCVLDEQPTSADIAPGRTGNYKWFSGQWYKPVPPTADHYTTTGNGLVVSLGGDLVDASQDFSASLLPTLSGKRGFYVEFEVSLSNNDPDHFPAVWIMPAEHNKQKQDHYETDPAGFERWIEFDVDEGGFGPGSSGAVHSWSGIYPHYERVTMKDLSAQALDRTKKHTFGISFDPVREQATWWIDDKRQKTVSLRGSSQVAKNQNFYLIISAQSHGKQRPYTMTVSRVRAFQPQS